MALRSKSSVLRKAMILLDESNNELSLLYALIQSQKNVPNEGTGLDIGDIETEKGFRAYYHLVPELELDLAQFTAFFRLSKTQFNIVLSYVEEEATKKNLVRESISAREQLALCIRFLATGESFRSLGFTFRIGTTTVSRIVNKMCSLIWRKMSKDYIKMPANEREWENIAENFQNKWQFPNCIGALDGKHIVIRKPTKTGSLYYNYEHQFSIVLLALVDANLSFIMVDIGGYGRNSDGGILVNSAFGRALNEDTLNLPMDCTLPSAEELGSIPYTIVADEAFPLQRHIMRPYPGKGIDGKKQILTTDSVGHGELVENAFGLLAARWRVFHTKIAVLPKAVNNIVKASCVLHNLAQKSSTAADISKLFDESAKGCNGLLRMPRFGYRGSDKALEIRDKLKFYFCEKDALAWQTSHTQRGLHTV